MIDKLTYYGLTGLTGIYNEENTTAHNLHIKNANKVKECLLTVSEISELVVSLTYDESDEELTIALKHGADKIRKELTSGYRWLYGEEPLTTIELSARTSKAVNECLTAVEDVAGIVYNIYNAYNSETEELTILAENSTITEDYNEIIKQIKNSFVDVYDECSFTSLELAGRTAKAVNECIKAVNMLDDMADIYINALSLDFSDENEELTVLGGN